jgi:hypothetical protein
MRQKIDFLAKAVSNLDDMAWISILLRLSDQDVEGLMGHLSYKSGNEIVRLDDTGRGNLHSFLRSMFGSMESGGHEHDCPNCGKPTKATLMEALKTISDLVDKERDAHEKGGAETAE